MKNSPRRLAVALLAAVMGAGMSTVAASPSEAASSYQPCPVSAFCLWRDTYRGGAVAFYRASNIGSGTRIAPSFAARASSLWNRSPYTIRVYVTPDCVGSPLLYRDFAPGAYVMRMSTYGINNMARSLQIVGGYNGRC